MNLCFQNIYHSPLYLELKSENHRISQACNLAFRKFLTECLRGKFQKFLGNMFHQKIK